MEDKRESLFNFGTMANKITELNEASSEDEENKMVQIIQKDEILNICETLRFRLRQMGIDFI